MLKYLSLELPTFCAVFPTSPAKSRKLALQYFSTIIFNAGLNDLQFIARQDRNVFPIVLLRN